MNETTMKALQVSERVISELSPDAYINMIIATAITVVLVFCGCWLFLKRFSLNRWFTKIAIISESSDDFITVKNLLADCKLVRGSNIEHLSSKEIKKLDRYSIVIVCENMIKDLTDIVGCINSKTGLIVFAPTQRLDDQQFDALNAHSMSMLVNFRGRLLSDVITMLITTEYIKGK